jgi:hypothetical protein
LLNPTLRNISTAITELPVAPVDPSKITLGKFLKYIINILVRLIQNPAVSSLRT